MDTKAKVALGDDVRGGKTLHGVYPDGVRVSAKEMKPIEARLQRSATRPNDDITIKPMRTE